MSRNQIIMRGFVDALGVLAYVVLFAWSVNNLEAWLGDMPETWLTPVFMLLVFIVSACVTGSLVLLQPILLYVEGQRKEAVHLFVYTIGFLVVLALAIGLIVVSALGF